MVAKVLYASLLLGPLQGQALSEERKWTFFFA